jgi:hypothetical protein
VAALQRKLRDVPPAETTRLVLLGHLGAARQCAAAATRVWWPVSLLAALCSRRARWVVAVAAAMRVGSARTPIVLIDDVAYGTGVWAGALRERTVAPLVPQVRTWPTRGER